MFLDTDRFNTFEENNMSWVRTRGTDHFAFKRELAHSLILLNEIKTMFSQLTKRSSKVLTADLGTDHEHYVKKKDQWIWEGKFMAVEGGIVLGNSQIHWFDVASQP